VRGHPDLRLAIACAIAGGVLALAIPVSALSLLFALPLALFLPGYAIVSAVFVRRPLVTPMLMTLSIGMSLSTLALGALPLDLSPGGVRGLSWTILLIAVTAAGCRVAALRRPAAGETRIPVPAVPRGRQAGLLAAAVLVAAVALALAFVNVPADKAFGFTELWMQPYSHSDEHGVLVGVGSNEQERTRYRLRVRFGREGPSVVRHLALRPGESRVLRLPTLPANAIAPRRVTAALFRARRPDRPYRRVSGWAPGSGAP
jgi:uncharacterized membrane protein